MKNLTNEEIIFILEHCEGASSACDKCPLEMECLHYFTGEECGSALEEK